MAPKPAPHCLSSFTPTKSLLASTPRPKDSVFVTFLSTIRPLASNLEFTVTLLFRSPLKVPKLPTVSPLEPLASLTRLRRLSRPSTSHSPASPARMPSSEEPALTDAPLDTRRLSTKTTRRSELTLSSAVLSARVRPLSWLGVSSHRSVFSA
jgi:hypothetical protein